MRCPFCRFGSRSLQPRDGVLDCPSCGEVYRPGDDADADADFAMLNPGAVIPPADDDEGDDGG